MLKITTKGCFPVFLSFPVIEETKLFKNWGKKRNSEFPHDKSINTKWGNQFIDKFPYSGDSGIKGISIYPLICCDLGWQISSECKKIPQLAGTPVANFFSAHYTVHIISAHYTHYITLYTVHTIQCTAVLCSKRLIVILLHITFWPVHTLQCTTVLCSRKFIVIILLGQVLHPLCLLQNLLNLPVLHFCYTKQRQCIYFFLVSVHAILYV